MTLLVPDCGEVKLLEYALNKTAATNVKIHLYKTDVTPAEANTVSSFTEATGTGYAAIALTGASWTIATDTGTSTAVYAAQTFTFTGADTIYGYYVTDNGGTNLLWAEKFASVFNIPSDGGTITVTPKLAAA